MARKSLAIAIALSVVIIMLGLTTDPNLPIAVSWAQYTNFYALFIVLLAFGIVLFYRRYRNYKQGYEGENRVSQYLNSNFGDDYFLINDLVYVNDRGHKANIDHVVLGPNGIFAIETKDYRGKIAIKGSFWTVPFPYGRSPSKQAQGNAFWVKKTIDESMSLENVKLWVDPIVVFSNPDVELDPIDPEVEVVKLNALVDSINSFDRGYNFSSAELKTVGKKLIEKASEPQL